MSVIAVVSRQLPFRIFAFTSCLLALSGLYVARAQSFSSSANLNLPATPVAPERRDSASTTEISLGVFGQLSPTRIPTTINSFTAIPSGTTYTSIVQDTQGTSASAGVEGTFHQQFRRLLGYNVNLGYSRFTENYSVASATSSSGTSVSTGYLNRRAVETNMYELGATAVVEGPRSRRFSTSAEAGGAVLSFLPTSTPSPTSVQFRPALAFGVGFNYKLTDHLSTRVAYRGLFYKNPDFRNPGYIPNDLKLFTITSEPAVSFVYTFGKHAKSR